MIHSEVFVSMDNYVYPSDEETIEVEEVVATQEEDVSNETKDNKKDSKKEIVNKKTTVKKVIRVKKKAPDETIKKLDVAYRQAFFPTLF